MGNLNITNTDDSSWSGVPAGFNTVRTNATQALMSAFAPVNTINLTITWAYVAFPHLGTNSTNNFGGLTYSQIRTALQNLSNKNSIQASAFSNTILPASDPLSAASYTIPWIQWVAVGGDNTSSQTMTVIISSSFGFDTSPWGDTNSGGFPLFGVMMHEMTESLGRACYADSGSGGANVYSINDLMTFNSGSHSISTASSPRYVSYDSLIDLYDLNQNSGAGDLGDSIGPAGDAYQFQIGFEVVSRSSTLPLRANDWIWMTNIGWPLTPTGMFWAGLGPDPSFVFSGSILFDSGRIRAPSVQM